MSEPVKLIRMNLTLYDGTPVLCTDNCCLAEASSPEDLSIDGLLIIKGQDLPDLKTNTPVYAYIHSPSGVRVRYSGWVSLSTEFQLNILYRQSSRLVVQERRRFYKVRTELPARITSINRQGILCCLDKPLPVTVTDMSLGGICMVRTGGLLERDDVVTLRTDVFDNVLDLSAKILRADERPGGQAGYGCQFLGLNQLQEGVLSRYINRIQRDNILKARQKLAEEPEFSLF